MLVLVLLRHSRLVAMAAAFCVYSLSTRAEGFCQKRTCAADCVYDGQGCMAAGNPLFWPTTCVSYGIAGAGLPADGIDFDTAYDVISRAYQAWISVDCAGSYPAIDILPMANPLTCDQLTYNVDGPNANVWVFRDEDWPYMTEGVFDGMLALTSLTFNADTGAIYDADVEINAFGMELTTDDEVVVDDLLSIATHEVGHFFGLDHTLVAEATMSVDYQTGDTSLRTLEADDVLAMCALFPVGRQAEDELDCAPRHGFPLNCGQDVLGTGGAAGAAGAVATGGAATPTGGMSAVASGGMAPELPPPKPKSSGGCSCDLRGDHGLRTVTDSAAVLILLLVLGGYRRQRQANIA
jgi:hypothetical protein